MTSSRPPSPKPAPSEAQVKEAVTISIGRLMSRAGITGSVHGGVGVISGLGLTSEDGVEIACMLEAELGISIPKEANPLVEDVNGTRRERTADEVCAAVLRWARAGGTR